MGKIITISTHKGGAGKTTIASNLAAQLSLNNKDVCLVDLDGQCGLSIVFGKSPKKHIGKSILSIIDKTSKLVSAIDDEINIKVKEALNDSKGKLSIIYSEPNLKGYDHLLNQNKKLNEYLKKTLEYLKEQFDYVVIDTPPAMSSINLLSFTVTDLVIMPYEPERQNIEGAFSVIEELENKIYSPKIIKYLLPIKVKERTIIDRELLEYVESKIALDKKANVIVSEYKIPNTTQYKSIQAKEQVPLVFGKGKSKVLLNHKELIKNITDNIISLLN